MAWDKKSFALQREGKYEEAAYCLNQAHAKYPSKDPRPEGNRKIPWLEADQAFALKKATLYLRMRKPDLAMAWLDRLQFQGDATDKYYRSTALVMKKDYEGAAKLLDGKPSLLQAAVLVAQGKDAEGKEMLQKEWTKLKSKWMQDSQNPEKRGLGRYVWWMEYPDELQKAIEKIDPSANSALF